MRILASVLLFAAGCAAQEFEAASVRENRLDDRIVTINVGPGGRFTARGYTLVLLMQRAYGVMDWNVTGGPAWIRTARWDVNATAEVNGHLTESQLRPMLQKLLADRFLLQVHRTMRESPGYALVPSPGGARIRKSSEAADRDSFRMDRAGLEASGFTVNDFARFVAGKLGMVAVDQTGLTGFYHFRADWAKAAELAGNSKEDYRDAVIDALDHQLGLKFVPRRIGIPTIAIDRVEKASEN